MRKAVLIALVLVLSQWGLSLGQGNSSIVINEFEPNPAGGDSGNEWVELYNRTDSNISVAGWSLEPTHGKTFKVVLANSAVVPAKGYLVVFRPDGKQWLDNKDESVILRNSSGTEVDRTLTANDSKNNNQTWQRCPNGFDSNKDSDWSLGASSSGRNDAGASNNCS